MSEPESTPQDIEPRKNADLPARTRSNEVNNDLRSVHDDDAVDHGSEHLSGHTPKERKRPGALTSKGQVEFAREADPEGGICLLTRRDCAIETCHLLASSTSDRILTKLELAWGWARNTFNVDTRYNLFFLRADWHHLFDQGRFMLIPTLEPLIKLHNFTNDNGSNADKVNINTLWEGQETFIYHVLAMPELNEPICRFDGPEKGANHTTYHPPFVDLGPLTSHVQPHFVVLNSAPRILALSRIPLPRILAEVSHNEIEAYSRISLTALLYNYWIEPGRTASEDRGSPDNTNQGSSRPPSNRGSGGPQPSPGGDGGNSGVPEDGDPAQPENQNSRDQHDSAEPLARDSEADRAVEGAGSALSDGTTWVEDISGWAKDCSEVASQAGWEPDILNDEQVVDYSKENPRYAPPPESWANSVPRFEPSKEPGKHWNTARFCSNDWVIYYGERPLFGRGR